MSWPLGIMLQWIQQYIYIYKWVFSNLGDAYPEEGLLGHMVALCLIYWWKSMLCWRGCGEKGTLMPCWWDVHWCIFYGKEYGGSSCKYLKPMFLPLNRFAYVSTNSKKNFIHNKCIIFLNKNHFLIKYCIVLNFILKTWTHYIYNVFESSICLMTYHDTSII